MTKPSVVLIFVSVGIFQAVSSFHRPAMTALIQKIVDPVDFKAVGTLRTFMYSIAAIVGPALGGLLIAAMEVKEDRPHIFTDIKSGFTFLIKKPEIMGSYIIDLVAMIFAFPVALFPAMSQGWGGARAAGFWAFFILWLGFAPNLYWAVLLLIFAGAADAVSGIFRQTIWNLSIPNHMRGRLSGIEMISYMAGPLLGNARAGYIASIFTVNISLVSGGMICLICIVLTALLLPKFWKV